jgi:predicted PurR-regulated permease PerM
MGEQDTRRKIVISISRKTCLRVGVAAFLLYVAITWWRPLLGLLGRAVKASAPLFIGIALAYMVNILMSVYEKHYFRRHADQAWVIKTRRAVCLIGAIATVLGAAVLLLGIVLPQLMEAVTVIKDKVPGILQDLSKNENIMKLLPEGIQDAVRKLDYEALVEGVLRFLSNGASMSAGLSSVTVIIGSFTSAFMIGFMGFIFSIYILLEKERLGRQFTRVFHAYLSDGWVAKIRPLVHVADGSFHNYIVGQVAEAIIIGALCGIGMWIFRLPYAGMVGAVIGVTALIPVLGCYLGAGVGALMCLSVSPVKALEFLIFIFCLQQIEDNLIYPRIVGTSLGLPGIWVLACVSVGGGIGGVLGMVLAVPVTATIYQLIRMDVQRRERQDGKRLTPAGVAGRLKREEDT